MGRCGSVLQRTGWRPPLSTLVPPTGWRPRLGTLTRSVPSGERVLAGCSTIGWSVADGG